MATFSHTVGYESEGLNIQLPETISSSKLPLAAGPGDEKRKSRYQPIIRPVEEFDYEDVNPQHMVSQYFYSFLVSKTSCKEGSLQVQLVDFSWK